MQVEVAGAHYQQASVARILGIYPDAKQPLADWYDMAKKAAWSNLAETRRDFPHADPCGQCTIFNIKGNQYRLITKINYPWQVIYIRFVLTHAVYDKGRWKHDCRC